jgi:hypothetical protein
LKGLERWKILKGVLVMANKLKERYAKIKRGNNRTWYIKDDIELEKLGISSFKSLEGSNYIALLPQPNGSEYFKEIYAHYDVGVNNDAYLCPNKMFNDKCPLCDYAKKLKNSGEPSEVFSDFLPRKRYLFFILDMTDKVTQTKGIKLFDAPFAIMKGIIGISENPRTKELIDVSDPDENINVVYSRKGTKKNSTEYGDFQKEERTKPIPEKFLEEVPSFEDIFVEPDINAMNESLLVSDEDDNEKEPPRRSTGQHVSEEDNDDEKPVRKSIKQKDKDEEEEEEQPRRKSISKKESEDDNEKPTRKPVGGKSINDNDEADEKVNKRERVRGTIRKLGRATKDEEDNE